jgi:hypothetical protein
VRPMPGPPIGIDLRIDRVRKRRVNLPELAQRLLSSCDGHPGSAGGSPAPRGTEGTR